MFMKRKISGSTIVIILFSVVCYLQATSSHRWVRNEVLKYDPSGYYLFLPATFIYHDLGKLAFYAHIDSVYKPSGEIHNYALYEQESTQKRSNKYAIGTAIGELPLFLITHFVCTYFLKNTPADGYSEPYQFAVAMSNLIWSIGGLVVLCAFLKKYFNDKVVIITLLMIGFGTNFYCYTITDQGMSHNLAFLLFSCILYFTERWYNAPKSKYAVFLGLFLGWVAITRPVDFIVVLIPLFWPINSKNLHTTNRLKFWWQHKKDLTICLIACTFVVCFQLAYWKYTTGHFLHFSYEEEGFNFNNPQVLNGLFSFRKGWFIYTPIALLGCLGILPLFQQNKKMALPVILFFICFIYIIYSWWLWWYGWSFGSRPMIESYAILAIPLASLIYWFVQKKPFLISLGIGLGLFFIWLNIYQTEQYCVGTIQGDKMTKEFYWRVWNKMHASPEDWKYYNK